MNNTFYEPIFEKRYTLLANYHFQVRSSFCTKDCKADSKTGIFESFLIKSNTVIMNNFSISKYSVLHNAKNRLRGENGVIANVAYKRSIKNTILRKALDGAEIFGYNGMTEHALERLNLKIRKDPANEVHTF